VPTGAAAFVLWLSLHAQSDEAAAERVDSLPAAMALNGGCHRKLTGPGVFFLRNGDGHSL
jgi:hypothetical protein